MLCLMLFIDVFLLFTEYIQAFSEPREKNPEEYTMRIIKSFLAVLLALLLLLGTFSVSALDLSKKDAEIDTALERSNFKEIAQTGVTDYGILVGKTYVTSDNMNDVLDDGGSVKYVASSKTLVLNNPVISEYYDDDGIIVLSNSGITLTGTFHMNRAISKYGIASSTDIIFNGDFTFYGIDNGVIANDNIMVQGGTLIGIATGDNSDGIYLAPEGSLDIKGGIRKVRGQGTNTAILTDIINLENARVTDPKDAYFSSDAAAFLNPERTELLKDITIEPFSGTMYDVWVGYRRVMSDNLDDVLDDGGSVKYDPDKKTITLDNPSINGGHNLSDNSNMFKICSADDLTVEGRYTMNSADTYGAIRCDGDLTVAGDFTLTGSGVCLYSHKNIIIKSGNLNSSGDFEIAVLATDGTVTIGGDITKADIQAKSYPIWAKKISLSNDIKITEPENANIGADPSADCEFIINSENRAAKHVIFECKDPNYKEYNLWVGSIRVTSSNYSDILEDGGKAVFNPYSYTLTLNNPSISDTYENSGNTFKIFTTYDLTLKGSYKDISGGSTSGIYSSETLTFSGSFRFQSDKYAVYGEKGVTVSSGDLQAVSGGACALYAPSGPFEVVSGVTKVDMEGAAVGLLANQIKLGDRMVITRPENGKLAYDTGVKCYTIIKSDGTLDTRTIIEYDNTTPTETTQETSSTEETQPPVPPEQEYDLWLGETRVTSQNKDDIMSDGGAAKYDPDTHTLTLSDPVIKGYHMINGFYYKIYSKNIDLKIKGSYVMPKWEEGYIKSYYGFVNTSTAVQVSGGSLTLEGDFVFYSELQCFVVSNDFTVVSGNIYAECAEWNALKAEGKINIENGIDTVEFKSSASAAVNSASSSYTLGDLLYVETPAGADEWKNNAKDVVIKHNIWYDLYLGDTQVTRENKNDILKDGGKAKFDVDTNTLTLQGPVIGGSHAVFLQIASVIYSGLFDLTIQGNYYMSNPSAEYAVYSGGNLTLDGSFTLLATDTAIYSGKSVMLKSGVIKAAGTYSFGINAQEKISVKNKVSRLEISGNVCAAACRTAFELDTGIVIASPENGSITMPAALWTVTDQNGRVAKSAVFESPVVLDLEGDGSVDTPYLIKTTEDWNKLSDYILRGGVTRDKNFSLVNNISIYTMLGTDAHTFDGIFEGNGNTLQLSLESDGNCCAPFSRISGAVIKNVVTAGTVKGGMHCSGLVGAVSGEGENFIKDCVVKANITCLQSHCGGILAHGGTTARTELNHCVFDGKINDDVTNAGTIWGWSDNGSQPILTDCLDVSNSKFPIAIGEPQGTVTNTYYTKNNKAAAVNRGWTDTGNLAYRVEGRNVTLSLPGRPGVLYGGRVYAAENETVNIKTGEDDVLYIESAGNLTQNGSNLTLVMPASNLTISPSAAVKYTQYSDIDGTAGNKNEGVENLMDGDHTTKWCVSGAKFPISMTFKTPLPVVPLGYSFSTASDAKKYPGRNPVSWKIEGSNDGVNWTAITQESGNNTLGAENEKTYAFTLTNKNMEAYSNYRFTVNSIKSGTTFQLSDIQLLVEEKYYQVRLANTQVTSLNKHDILGDGGKAQYDPETNTLTLDEPVINGAFKHTSGFSYHILNEEPGGLKVKGSYHMTSRVGMVGIGSFKGGMSFEGDFTIMGQYEGLEGSGNMEFKSGTMKVVSTDWYGIANYEGDIIFGPDLKLFDSTCDRGNAVYVRNGEGKIDGSLRFVTPENGENWMAVRTHHVIIKKYEEYDLWVGSTRVTSFNCDDILSDGGKAVYDDEKKELTLDDPHIDGVSPGSMGAKILSNYDITLKGSYAMTSQETAYGIYSTKSLTLDGDFTFMGKFYAIITGNNLKISSGKVRADSGGFGIYSPEEIAIENGIEKLESHGNVDSITGEKITLSDSLEITTPEDGYVGDTPGITNFQSVLDKNGRGVKNAVIEKVNIIRFDMNGHGEQIDSQILKIGDKAEKPEDPSETGYTFGGWYTDRVCIKPFDFSQVVTNSQTLYAKWIINKYTVEFDMKSHGQAIEPQSVEYMGKVEKPDDPTATGYTFKGWFSDDKLTKAYDFDTAVTEGFTLYAKWTINTYTVKFNMNGHGDQIESQSVKYKKKAVKPEDPVETGYTFGGWFSDKALTKAYDFDSAVTKNLTLYAMWTVNTYTVKFNANGGSGTMQSVKVNYGEEYVLPECTFVAPEKKEFDKWNKGKLESKITITADVTLKAIWKDRPDFLGDVDGDYKITIMDASYIQMYLASLDIPIEMREKVADVDGDGKITIIDVSYIQMYLAKIDIPYKVGEPV